MKSAVRVGTLANIGVYLHWTFALLIAGIFAFYLFQGETMAAALTGVVLVLAVFACVVLHELGHALMARRFDVATRDITLYPIGGVARLQRIPEEPIKEFWIALAGPAVNVVIAGALFVVVVLSGGSLAPAALLNAGGAFLSTLLWINLLLVGFNLLPAFPMDGGRVLRALLALRMDYARATEIAAGVGQGMAILFGLLGLISWNPILLFIAFFVYVGARQEAQQAMIRALTQGIAVRQAMVTRFHVLKPQDPLGHAIDELLAGSEQDFPVVDEGEVVGVLTRKRLMQALANDNRHGTVGDVLEQDFFTVEDNVMLDEAFRRMHSSDSTAVPVLRRGELVGMLTLENVGELMMISSALKKAGARNDVRQLVSRSRPDTAIEGGA